MPDFSQAEVVADCAVCGKGRVFALGNQYVCDRAVGPKPECTFKMGRNILQRDVPPDQVRKLMADGKTDLLPKFISKKGRPFSAFLVRDKTGKVGFEFAPREGKAGGKKGNWPKKAAPVAEAPAKKKPARKKPAPTAEPAEA